MTSHTLLVLAFALPVVVRIGAVKQRTMFMRNALGSMVHLFRVFFLFVKRSKKPQQFIVRNDELYEYDSESRRYYPWKSSVPKQ
jgi:hypothetical protein